MTFLINTGAIALYEPEIAVNTGNIIRLAAGLSCSLHLIHPLGFNLSDKGLKRAGLDYHDLVNVIEHSCFENFLKDCQLPLVAFSTKGAVSLFEKRFIQPACLIFGPETRGLPEDILRHDKIATTVKIPQSPTHRSLNLSNAVAIAAYEQARQLNS